MKINIQNNMIRAGAILLSVVVLFCSVVVSGYADSNTLEFLPQSSNPSTFATYNGPDYTIFASSENTDSVVCAAYGPNLWNIVFCSLEQETFYTKKSTDNSIVTYYTNSLASDYGIYNYTYSVGASRSSYFSIPAYNSLEEALSACKSKLEESNNGNNPAGRFAGRLAPGYVGYFDVSNLSDVSVVLGTTLYSGAKYSGFSTTQAIGTSSSLPQGQFSLPIPGTTPINWNGSSQKNLIGQYSSFAYRYTITSSGNTTYLVIVNPFTGSAPTNTAWEASAANRNNYITVLIDQCRSYKVFSLTESVNITDNGWNEESTTNGDSSSGYYDDDSGSWVGQNDQTGESQNFNDLPIGGGNDPYVGNVFDSIAEFLENIANQIKQFFTGAIGAVTTLVNAGSSFINTLVSLYSWLPAPVYAVLSSALILVITIGVIKVFI